MRIALPDGMNAFERSQILRNQGVVDHASNIVMRRENDWHEANIQRGDVDSGERLRSGGGVDVVRRRVIRYDAAGIARDLPTKTGLQRRRGDEKLYARRRVARRSAKRRGGDGGIATNQRPRRVEQAKHHLHRRRARGRRTYENVYRGGIPREHDRNGSCYILHALGELRADDGEVARRPW